MARLKKNCLVHCYFASHPNSSLDSILEKYHIRHSSLIIQAIPAVTNVQFTVESQRREIS